MYSCTTKVYFAGCPEEVIETVGKIRPLAAFNHVYEKSSLPDMELASKAGLIIAGPGFGNRDIQALIDAKSANGEIIVLAEENRTLPPELLAAVTDLWRWPMNESELRFRFGRWQEHLKCILDLAEKGQFLECLMETSPNLIWFKDKSGVHELVNRSFCETVNKPRSDVQGQRHAYIWNVEDDDPACIESERIVMESGQVHSSEEQIVTGEGQRILITYKSPLRDADNSMMGTMGIAIDVTNERRYREKLIQSNTALENIFTTMDCGILCHSLDGKRVLSVNQAALRMLGYADKHGLENDFQMVAATVLDDDKRRLRSAIGQLRNAGDSASYEYKVRHEDGALRHIMGNAKLVEKDGEIICQRFLLDCTDQKIAEEKERIERDRRHKELVRALSVDFQLVLVFDADADDGRIVQLLEQPDTQLMEVFSGSAPLEAKLGAYIETCVHPDDREACREAFSVASLRQRLAKNDIYYFNYRALKDGDTHYFQMKAVRSSACTDSWGIVIGLQSVDSRTRQELEQRTVLSEALKQARRASDAKSIFLSNMSHDIRTPMNAVLGYATLAQKHINNPDAVAGYLNKITNSGSHLINLINDILDMSHIESGKVQLDESLWNLPGLLQDLCAMVQPATDAKMQTLELDMGDLANGDVYCDRLRLKQVLLNLLSNANKYTGEGGQIRLRVRQIDCPLPERASYELTLTDNGIGMTQSFLERIFEPFERAQCPEVANIQGTGLGMAITRNIVELMKGEISVKSEPGKGTEFRLALNFRVPPASEQAASEAPEPDVPGHGDASAPAEGHSARLLLAEDNEMNQEIASEFLTNAGYTLEIANNGQEAYDLVKNAEPGHFALILMDVQMPLLDGYRATSLIRSLPDKAKAELPIIAMTANSFEEDRMEALKRGMNAHIAKPIDFKLLFKTLDSFLANREKS